MSDLKALFGERNPGVMRAAISQCVRSWTSANEPTRTTLRLWLLESFGKTPIAIVCSNFLVNFGDPYSSGIPNWTKLPSAERRDLWALWADLVQVYLKAIASQPFVHNSAHMYDSLKAACGEIDKTRFLGVIESWVTWICGQVEMRILDDCELPAAELLLTEVDSGESRERLITLMLNHRDTGFAITTASFIVKHWQALSAVEQLLLMNALNSDRVDARWLRALAITRDVVPAPIQELLLGCSDFLSKGPESILSECHCELLSDSIHLYCGEPQPLWW